MTIIFKRANALTAIVACAIVLSGCVALSPDDQVKAYRYDASAKASLSRQLKNAVPGGKGSLTYSLMHSSQTNMSRFSGDGRARNRPSGQAPAIMHVHLEKDYQFGLPLYRLVLKPRNFTTAEMANWGPAVSFKPYSSVDSRYFAPLPKPLSLSADKAIRTPWVYCPSCLNKKIDNSPEGMRVAENHSRTFGGTQAVFTSSLSTKASVPNDLLTGNAARQAAREMGERLKKFRLKRRDSTAANKAYSAFMKDYTDSLPETAMKRDGCRDENSASKGSVKDARRAVRQNLQSLRCRSRILDGYDFASYQRSLPELRRKEGRLYAAGFGVQRKPIYTTEEVRKRAEKLVNRSRQLAKAFGADAENWTAQNARSRERRRREEAARAQIFRSAAETNRQRQQQQRDVGTQRIDPNTGRVTTRSQREAAAAQAGRASLRRNQSTSRSAAGSGSGNSDTGTDSSSTTNKRKRAQPLAQDNDEPRTSGLGARCVAETRAWVACLKAHPAPKLGQPWKTPKPGVACAPAKKAETACFAKYPKAKSVTRSTISR
ncbi:MAG: hypothetical protein AAGF28_05365 [Pseudomonadota bacterium]